MINSLNKGDKLFMHNTLRVELCQAYLNLIWQAFTIINHSQIEI